MARHQIKLIDEPAFASEEEMEEYALGLAARYPESAACTMEETAEFYTVAWGIDRGGTARWLVKLMRRARVPLPPYIQTDLYKMGRYLFYRWREPEIRAALLTCVEWDQRALQRLKQHGSQAELLEFLEVHGALAAYWLLGKVGGLDRYNEVVTSLSEQRQKWYRSSVIMGQVLMHRYLTEHPCLDPQPSRSEQKAIARRIRRRSIQLRSLRHSLYAFSLERKQLLGRARRAERAAEAELERLTARLDKLRAETEARVADHARSVSELAARRSAELEALREQLATAHRDFAEALAERSAWAPSAPLRGQVVCVVGDEEREPGYRVLVESLGGRLVHVSGVAKLNRIPDVAAGADVVILMTDNAKHAADYRLRKAVRREALVLRCPRTGLASFERFLHAEALPRLLMEQAAAGGEPHA